MPGAIDTIYDYAFVSRGAIDGRYSEMLRVRFTDLVRDVLMVDFTRPVFSTDRCDLLEFVPELPGPVDADALRDGLIANLEAAAPAATSPAGVLLANLKDRDDLKAHTAKVDGFLRACKALGSRPLVENALAIVSLNRNKAREMAILEFPESLPIDDQKVHRDARLSPKSCELVNQFVAP